MAHSKNASDTASSEYIAQSVMEVAAQSGFIKPAFDTNQNTRRTIVMEDSQGRAVVAKLHQTGNGTKMHLDLTGMGDRSCHSVMDSLLGGLAKRGIDLRDVQHQSHYRREGVLQKTTGDLRQQEADEDTANHADRLRRRSALNINVVRR
jgi:hypothetical protein